MLSDAGVPGTHALQRIAELVNVAPPSLETPTPMPWPPPFDQRSSCHMPIALSPWIASVGSTSAFRKFRPPVTAICAASCDAHAARGEARAEALTGLETVATPLVEATRTNALESALVHKAFFSKSQSPLLNPRRPVSPKNLIPARPF